ncbi:MAG: nicotinamide mononucleotide transporter [Oscillospiraceae bacterium]|nr:nicotinamide mononucleotide transporter [Oscillospiraceae bacterium]
MKKNETGLIKSIKAAAAIVCLAAAVICFLTGTIKLTGAKESYTFLKNDTFYRVTDALEEEYEDETVCPVEFITADEEYTLVCNFTYEQWEALPGDAEIEGYIYVSESGGCLTFAEEPTQKDIKKAERNKNADAYSLYFGIGMAALLAGVGIGVITVFGKFFTAYEQIWFVSILLLAAVFSIIFPEESSNGVNGLIIMALYLLDTFLNILCELLISKQSKWNFIVSVFVELAEIAICIVLMYRFATLASTLFFWLPCDIISFINWHKHPDREEEELTVVRTLKGWQEVLIIASIFVWTIGVGYFLTTLDLGSDFFKSRTIEVIVCYMDACVSAVGIVNGVFILLRLREQWIAWYIDAILEGIINILSGQYVLLILKLGYLTNTTYGYIKWTKYIKSGKK